MKPKARPEKSLLVIGRTLPMADRSSQGLRLLELVRRFAGDFEVDFVAVNHIMKKKPEFRTRTVFYATRDGNFNTDKFLFLDGKYARALEAAGVNVLTSAGHEALSVRPTSDFPIGKYLRGKSYHAVLVEGFSLADQYWSEIRKYQPAAQIFVDAVELQFEKLLRQARHLESNIPFFVNVKHEPTGAPDPQKVRDHFVYQEHVLTHETKLYRKCDYVVVSSEQERSVLSEHISSGRVLVFPKPAPERAPAANPHSGRKNLVFLGDFDQNRNVSSALQLKHQIGPALEARGLDLPLLLIGNNPVKIVRTMAKYGPYREHIRACGHKKRPEAFLDQALCTLAPVSFQNSPPYKILYSLASGVPVITNPTGASLLALEHGVNCLIAASPDEFAGAIESLRDDVSLWNRLSRAGLEKSESYRRGEGNVERAYADILNALDERAVPRTIRSNAESSPRLPEIRSLRPAPKAPDVSVVIVTFNQWQFTELCLKSIVQSQLQHPEIGFEVIVVDNNSVDETRARLAEVKAIRLLPQKKNLGFAAGVNAGIRAARGKNVVVLNNDTVVPPAWLRQFLDYSAAIGNVGIIGPSSNTEALQAIPHPRYASLGEFFRFASDLAQSREGEWDTLPKISGLCMFIPKSVIGQVGLLSEEYGIGYFEDDDYCMRVRAAGLKLVWAKDIYVHHFGSMSFEGNRISKKKHLSNGMKTFVFKWGKAALDHIAETHNGHLLSQKSARKDFF